MLAGYITRNAEFTRAVDAGVRDKFQKHASRIYLYDIYRREGVYVGRSAWFGKRPDCAIIHRVCVFIAAAEKKLVSKRRIIFKCRSGARALLRRMCPLQVVPIPSNQPAKRQTCLAQVQRLRTLA